MICSKEKTVRTNVQVITNPNKRKAEKQRDLQRQQQRKNKRSD